MIRFLLTYALLMVTTAVFTQAKTPTPDELTARYQKRSSDTDKVRLLLQLDSLYLYKMPDTGNVLDSALLMARQARDMSATLRFKQGYEDATFLIANSFAKKNDVSSALSVANNVKGPLQIHIFIMLGEHYTFKPGELPQNLDSAYLFIMRAKNISDSIHSLPWLYQSLGALGKYYFARGNFAKAKGCFMRMIEDYHRSGNTEREAFWWNRMADFMPDTDSSYAAEIQCFTNALTLYGKLKSIEEQRHIISDIAWIHQRHGKLDLAESMFLESVRLADSIGDKKLYTEYFVLSGINLSKGNYNTALYYALAAMRNADSLQATSVSGIMYFALAEAYRALDKTDESIQWYRASLDHLISKKINYRFPACGRIVHALLQQGKAAEALLFLQNFIRKTPALRLVDKEIVAAAMGDCFNALKNYKAAEKYYLQMIALGKQEQAHKRNEIVGDYMGGTITSSDANFIIGRFYVERKQYQLAEPYLILASTNDFFAPPLSQLRDVHLLLFKIDSANGNYMAAVKQLQIHKQLNDSIFNEAKSRQIEELQIQYATRKKEADLREAQAREKIQTRELQSAAQARNFTYILIAALTVLVVVGYSRYKLKQKSNLQLQLKQQEINQKNETLEYLLKDKDKLINEKDVLLEEKQWLLKEMHHRVKNNLQIITSLLNTQSKYLNNEEAIAAIAESRHRMQAMSLIHQKLYESENTANVNMQTYIGELTAYLKTSFNTGRKLNYELHVNDIELDITYAIPVGLILNEAITNAIKYAFSDRENGVIFISMKHCNSKIQLKVHDNGKGLPEGFDIDGSDSMGLRLVRGLAKQIDGNLVIKNEQGVCIEVEFKMESLA